MNNNDLVIILKDIIKNIEENKYKPQYTLYLSELLQKFQFVVEMNDNSNIPKRDVINFLSLGWYIYNNIIETN